jgi:hypothetical protein
MMLQAIEKTSEKSYRCTINCTNTETDERSDKNDVPVFPVGKLIVDYADDSPS